MPAQHFRVFATIVGACLLLAPDTSVAASLSKNPAGAHVLPVRITGADVPDLRCADPAGLTVPTCRDGRPTPIPFQVDEFNARGRLVATGGITNRKNRKRDERPRKIDENDELVAMMRDIGDACSADQLERVAGRGLRLPTVIRYDQKLSLAGRVQFVDDPEHESQPESRKGAVNQARRCCCILATRS